MLLNKHFLCQLKNRVVIINAARAGIVNEQALLQLNNPIVYCTDVYTNEPQIDPQIINFSYLCTPHIAGHSLEAKHAAVLQISEQLHQFYQQPMPVNPVRKTYYPLSHHHSWQEHVLAIYDPSYETKALKTASNKTQAFLSLREAHHHRHDFNLFNANQLDKQTRLILGSNQ